MALIAAESSTVLAGADSFTSPTPGCKHNDKVQQAICYSNDAMPTVYTLIRYSTRKSNFRINGPWLVYAAQ